MWKWTGTSPFGGYHKMAYRISQNTYLQIVSHYAEKLGLTLSKAELHQAALEWEALSSGRSGRVAYQFVTDLAGRIELGKKNLHT